jgi:hypothetical protein
MISENSEIKLDLKVVRTENIFACQILQIDPNAIKVLTILRS